MRSTTNLLIINLAASDILFVIFCVPFTATDYILPTWPFGDVWCKVVSIQYTNLPFSHLLNNIYFPYHIYIHSSLDKKVSYFMIALFWGILVHVHCFNKYYLKNNLSSITDIKHYYIYLYTWQSFNGLCCDRSPTKRLSCRRQHLLNVSTKPYLIASWGVVCVSLSHSQFHNVSALHFQYFFYIYMCILFLFCTT